ncbi:MAG: YqjF family protein [Natrinema limicola]
MTEQRTAPFRWPLTGGSSLNAPHVTTRTLRNGLFAHWPVDPDELRPHVPSQLALETWDGRAWVSVLPFVLTNVGLRGTPSIARLAFGELTVRTYVRYRGTSGLFFFSIDIGRSLIATTIGRTTGLPVYGAAMRVGATDENRVAFRSRRRKTGHDTPARFAATYRPTGAASPASPDTLEYWLTARRWFYAPTARGIVTGDIAHDPWPLQPATVTIYENTMFEADGLPSPTGEPVVHYVDGVSMTGSIPWLLRGR